MTTTPREDEDASRTSADVPSRPAPPGLGQISGRVSDQVSGQVPAEVEIVGGLDAKGPAAILVSFVDPAGTPRRILLDAGDGPDPEERLDLARVSDVDAVLVTHDHEDHIAALHRWHPRCPVYATRLVARGLPPSLDWREIPTRGAFDVFGLRVLTGRTGHALGGVWFHLAVCGGLLYTGDFCRESAVLAHDDAPPAATVLADASYGAYERSLDAGQAALLRLIAPAATLLPAPATGRAVEMALWLEGLGLDWSCDVAVADQIAAARAAPGLLLPEAADRIARLGAPRVADPGAPLRGVVVSGDPHAACRLGARHLNVIRTAGRPAPDGAPPVEGAGRDADGGPGRVVFTGYVPSHVAPLVDGRRVFAERWNVHPRLSDLAALARETGARRFVPLFVPLFGKLDVAADLRAALGASFCASPTLSLTRC